MAPAAKMMLSAADMRMTKYVGCLLFASSLPRAVVGQNGADHIGGQNGADHIDEVAYCFANMDCPELTPLCYDNDTNRELGLFEECSDNSTCVCVPEVPTGDFLGCHRGDGCGERGGRCYDIHGDVVLEDWDMCNASSACMCMHVPPPPGPRTYQVGYTIHGRFGMRVNFPAYFASDEEVPRNFVGAVAAAAGVPDAFVNVSVSQTERRLSQSGSDRALSSASNVHVAYSVKLPETIEAWMGVQGTPSWESVSGAMNDLDAVGLQSLLPASLISDYELSVDDLPLAAVTSSSGIEITLDVTSTTKTTTTKTTTTKTTTYYKAVAVVSGEIEATVPDPEAYCKDESVKEAFTNTVADAAGVDNQYVDVQLRVKNRRLEGEFAPSPRRLAGTVVATYTITLPDTPDGTGGTVSIAPVLSAEAVKAKLATVTPEEMTTALSLNLVEVLTAAGVDPSGYTISIDLIVEPTVADPPTTTVADPPTTTTLQKFEPPPKDKAVRVGQVGVVVAGVCVLATLIVGV